MRVTRVLHNDVVKTCMIDNGALVAIERALGGVPEPWEVALAEGDGFTGVGQLPPRDVIHLGFADPSLVLGAEDNFSSQPQSRKTGLAAMRPAAIEPFRRSDPSEDVWIIPRDPRSVAVPGHPIVRPLECEKLDLGVTLAVVTGPGGTVAGYSVGIDVIRRDVPVEHAYLARSYPSHLQLDSALCSPTELDAADTIELTLSIDGEERQHCSMSDLVVQPATLLASIDRRYRLAGGEVILMGTPPGTALDRGDGWLTDGATVVAAITGIGELRTHVVAATT